MVKTPDKIPATRLDDRLDCFGAYDSGDVICRRRCALAINCALARNEYLDGQALEGDTRHPKYAPKSLCRR
jgi:hypothetical protein